jgi:hypothetical protein
MPARVTWYDVGNIILYAVQDPLSLDELQEASQAVWALAEGIHEFVDLIFDYRTITDFPRGTLPVVRDGYFALPMLDRIALVGDAPLVEMMMATLSEATFRPLPTQHHTVEEAASYLRKMAQDEEYRR